MTSSNNQMNMPPMEFHRECLVEMMYLHLNQLLLIEYSNKALLKQIYNNNKKIKIKK